VARVSCRQPNLRMGEKGQPGARGIWIFLWKEMTACMWRVSKIWCFVDISWGCVIRGLKSQIWDSRCRERSAKRMVQDSGGELVDGSVVDGGNVAAKRQCRDGML